MNEIDRPLAARPRSSLALRIEALRRDAAIVIGDLLGRTPAPFSRRVPLARHASAPAPPADLLRHRSLRVERVVRETAETVSLHLVDPTGAPLAFEPGQFLTVEVALAGGQSAKRAYSLSSLPGAGEAAGRARITVKRIVQGKVSGHLHDHAREGDTLTVLGPSGHFGISAADARGKHLLLVSGGSGITPLRAIAEARLADPSVTATLLFGNRGEEDIVFRGELDALVAASGGRLSVRHVLESPPAGWTGGEGRLDRPTATREIEAILASEAARGRTTEVLVCGPTPMMEAVREVLGNLGVPAARVREEQFSSPEQRKKAVASRPQPVTFSLRGRPYDTIAAPGQTLLEAGLAAGVNMPFSCGMGGCGACKCKLTSGQVAADEPNCLSADEASKGFVLACVSRAASPVTLEVP